MIWNAITYGEDAKWDIVHASQITNTTITFQTKGWVKGFIMINVSERSMISSSSGDIKGCYYTNMGNDGTPNSINYTFLTYTTEQKVSGYISSMDWSSITLATNSTYPFESGNDYILIYDYKTS